MRKMENGESEAGGWFCRHIIYRINRIGEAGNGELGIGRGRGL